MHIVALFSLLTATTLAYTLPDDLPEGLYAFSIENGKEVHKLISRHETNEKIPPSDFLLTKRTTVTCVDDPAINNLDPTDTDKAVAALTNTCQQGGGYYLSGYDALAYRYGCTVAYICIFGGNDYYLCGGDSVPNGYREVTDACGRYKAGWGLSDNGYISVGYEDSCQNDFHFCGFHTIT